jgi:hypothetical protein
MDLIIQKNQDIQQKIIKRVISIDTAMLDTFRYTFCNKDKNKCFMACKATGECVSMCNDAHSTEEKKAMVSVASCRRECIARNMYKNRAFPVDSASFMMDTPEKVYKALSMEVTHLSLPSKIYNISGELRNNYFRIDDVVYEIPSGMYTIQELVNVISIAVVAVSIRFYYDSVIDRVYILRIGGGGSGKIIEFGHREGCEDMDFNTTLGWALGFRMPAYSTDDLSPADGLHYQDITNQSELKGNWPNQKYSGSIMPALRGEDADSNVITGAPILDYTLNNWRDQPGDVTAADKGGVESEVQRDAIIKGIVAEASPSIKMDYMYMIVDEFNRNKNDEYMTLANKFSNVLAKVPLRNTTSGISVDYEIFKEINRKRIYFSPINVEKINVKFLDRFGRKVDLGINAINATLEFECAYS